MATSQQSTKSAVGFIGLGSMGIRMAGRLLDAGYPLSVYNRTLDKARPLADRGASVKATPQELAACCDLICSCLTDDKAVEEAYLGPQGAVHGLRRGTVVVEFSTVLPHTAHVLAEAFKPKGVALLDAAVSGSTPQAEQGTLMILAGGEESVFDCCKGVLDVIGKPAFLMGPTGSGKMMKLVINVLLGDVMQAMAEAIALGEKGGLDKNRLLDVLAQSSVLGPAHKSKIENARREQYPTNFALSLMYKDFSLVCRRATELAVPMPVTAAAQQFASAEMARKIHEDFSAVVRAAEQAAGLQIPMQA